MAKLPRWLHEGVVVVTAAAAESARRSRRRGATRAAGSRSATWMDAGAEVASALGGDAVGLALDVATTGLQTFLNEVERRLGPVDVLLSNAGIMAVGRSTRRTTRPRSAARDRPRRRHPRDEGGRPADEAARDRRHRQRRLLGGKSGSPNLATYGATKHGVVGLSEAVRAELGGTGVGISVVMPASWHRS